MGFVVKRPLRMQEQCFFRFRAGLKKIQAGAEISREGYPRPNMESLLVRGGYLTSSLCDNITLFNLSATFGGPKYPSNSCLDNLR